jgi:hypothetical protein
LFSADSLLANKVVAGLSCSLIPSLPLRSHATETYLAVGLLLLQNHQYVTLAGGGRSFFIFGNHYFIQAASKPIAFYCH